MTFASELRRLLAERGVSPYALGERMGLTQGHVYRYTTQQRVPNTANLARIADELNLSDSELAGLVRAANHPQEKT